MKQQDTEKAAQFKSKKHVPLSPPINGNKSKQAKQPPSPSPNPSPELNGVGKNGGGPNKPKRVLGPRPNKSPKSPEAPRVKGSDKDRILGLSKNVPVVEFAKPTRVPRVSRSGESTRSQSVKKLSRSESLIENLQSSEVLDLKTELERVNRCNVQLRSENKSLAEDLAAAIAKIEALEGREKAHPTEEQKSPNFKAVQMLIASKLEQPRVTGQPISECHVAKPVISRKIPETIPSARPPPPPPPLPRSIATRKASSVEELYHSLSKRVINQNSPKNGNFNKPCVSSAHSSIVGEIQNRSAHLLAIKSDIETKGEFINALIEKVMAASFTDIEDVAIFVDRIDSELLCLADERAVLKHFKWPEKKADAIREAAIEYRSLKLLESEVSSYKDDSTIPYSVALKKMASLLDKSERSIQRLTALRNSVMRSYQDHKIPTDWMLDSGIVSKIKMGSRELAKKYVERLMTELQSIRHSERESTQETLLLQGVHFAYRAQQIAGSLDSETLCAFEEMRQWVPSGNLRGSQELILAGIPSA